MNDVLFLLLSGVIFHLNPHPQPPRPQPVYPPIVYGTSITTVLTTPQSGFFSVAQYKGKAHAGTYCLNCGGTEFKNTAGTSMIVDNVRESVYDLFPDPVTGLLFLSSENSRGRVYTWDGSQLKLFWQDPEQVDSTLGTRRIMGHLVTISGEYKDPPESAFYIHGVGRPYLPGSSTKFIRDIFEFKGKVLILGFDYEKEVGGWYESTDLIHWTWRELWPNMRFLRGRVTEGGNKLYIAGSPYTDGERHGPGVLIQTYTANPNPMAGDLHIAQFFDCQLVFGFDVDHHSGAVYVGAHMGWRAAGDAQIWRYFAGQWSMIAILEEAETPSMTLTNDGLYVATRQEGGNGKVYLIK